MRIVEFSIENFRSIYSLPSVKTQKLNIFIGRNNVGKTAILEALFIALRNISSITSTSLTTLSEKIDLYPEQLEKLWFFGITQKPAIIKIVLELDENEKTKVKEVTGLEDVRYAELEVHIVRKDGYVEWRLEKLNLAGYVLPTVIQRTNKVYKSVTNQELHEYTSSKIVEGARVLNDQVFSKFLEISKDKVFYLTPYVYMEWKKSGKIEGLLRPLLLPSEMIMYLKWLTSSESPPELRDKFYSVRKEFTPYHTLYYIETSELTKQLEYLLLKSECFGSGEQLIDGLLATVLTLSYEREGCIIMLEEPEVHLHPSYVRRLAYVLKRLVEEENLQIFVVTQSHDFIKMVNWDSVFVVKLQQINTPPLGIKYATMVEKLGKNKEIAEKLALELGISVGELAYIDLLILVEGKSEEDILERSIHILNAKGSLYNLHFYTYQFFKIGELNKESAIKMATNVFKGRTVVITDGDEEGEKIVKIAEKYELKREKEIFQWNAPDIICLFDAKQVAEVIKNIIDPYISKIENKGAQKRCKELLESIKNQNIKTKNKDFLRELTNIIFDNVDEVKEVYFDKKNFYYKIKGEIAKDISSKMREVPRDIERVLLLIDYLLGGGREL